MHVWWRLEMPMKDVMSQLNEMKQNEYNYLDLQRDANQTLRDGELYELTPFRNHLAPL